MAAGWTGTPAARTVAAAASGALSWRCAISSTPRLTKATAPSGSATATRHQSCTAGMPYTGTATISSSPQATMTVTCPMMSSATANDQRGKPAAAKRRSTPRSR